MVVTAMATSMAMNMIMNMNMNMIMDTGTLAMVGILDMVVRKTCK